MQRKQVIDWVSKAFDTILPPRCIVSGECVEFQNALSPKAFGNLQFITYPMCKKCGVPFDFDDGLQSQDEKHCVNCLQTPPAYKIARASVIYNDTARDMILGFKHGDQTHYAATMSALMIKSGQECLQNTDLIVPVPLHPMRLIKRRYNQAAILGKYIARHTKKPYLPTALQRVKATAPQGHMRRRDRIKNVRRAFIVPEKHFDDIVGKNICLIDDVMTTGATANECAKTLIKQGANSVSVLVLARVTKGGV